jgi:predicted nucleotidyltransferase
METYSEALAALQESKQLFLIQDFYTLHNNEWLIDRRIKGNLKARSLLKTAKGISRFLYQIPYVRAIGISGSLSKNFAAKDADIDYFIITSRNRLWVARTLMHFIKKLNYLLGRQHWYCMNYYIDTEALEIEEKNIFTAIELITLLPAQGAETLLKFYRSNEWATAFYPNYQEKMYPKDALNTNNRVKRALEYLLNRRIGDWLDNYCMRVTSGRWKRKEALQKRSVKGSRMSLFAGKHFAKPNPAYFQREILGLYHDRLNKLTLIRAEHFV